MDETQAASVSEEENGAPAETVEDAASTDSGAPAGPPEGYIEQDRYENLRKEFNQRNALIDRAKSGDNDALRELIGAEFAQDEEEDPALQQEDAEYVDDPRVAAHDQWIQQQQQQATLDAFNKHLDRLAGSPDVLDEFDRQALLSESIANGFNESATEAAFDRWKQRQEQLEKKVLDRYLKSKQAPHVSQGGTGATEDALPLDASHADRVRWMSERLSLGQQ